MKVFQNYIVTKEQVGLTVEMLLKQELHYSGRKLQKLTRLKGLFLNRRPVFLQKKVKENDTLRVLLSCDDDYGVTPESSDISICYEDDQLFVLNKPPRQLVHPTSWTTIGTLSNYLAGHLQKQGIIAAIRPVHRLDRDTSGCILFAKNDQAQHQLELQLKSGTLKRIYTVLVEGIMEPASGIIDAPVGEHPDRPNRRIVSEQGERAVTHYKTLETMPGGTSILEVQLETGRTHQIRVHFAHLGHPVLGDVMYGNPSVIISRQALHASAITFHELKSGKEITVTAPLPTDMAEAIKHFRTNAQPNKKATP